MRALAFRALILVALLSLAAPAFARGGGRRTFGGKDSMVAGDAAFTLPLETLDGKSTVDLIESNGRPVVLLFASYT